MIVPSALASTSVDPSCTLTGLARLEIDMAFAYSERPDGWPVGAQYHRRAYSCPTPTVQIIEQPGAIGARRYKVLTLFPFLHTDRRHPPSPLLSLHRARRFAIARLSALAIDGKVKFGHGPGIELARGGDHIGLDSRS